MSGVGDSRLIGCGRLFLPAADAGGYRFLGGRMVFTGALRPGVDSVCGLEGLDLFGKL